MFLLGTTKKFEIRLVNLSKEQIYKATKKLTEDELRTREITIMANVKVLYFYFEIKSN